MWRIWNNFPKVLRHQLHGSRASAGGVCVDEEKQEHNAELAHINLSKAEFDTTPTIVLSASDHLDTRALDGEGAEFTVTQRHCHNPRCHGKPWFKPSALHHHTSENGAEVGTVCSKKKDLEAASKLEPCTTRESNPETRPTGGIGHGDGEWRHQRCPGKMFRSKISHFHQRTRDVVSWGTNVVLGFHLPWQPSLGNLFRISKGPDVRQQWHGLVLRAALAMPADSFLGMEQSIMEQMTSKEESVKKSDKIVSSVQPPANVLEDTKTLADAVEEFMQSCRKYAAVGSTASGILDIDGGRLTRAVEQLEQASQLGHSPAYFNLALCYELGTGVQKDLTKAAKFYSKAAEMGHSESLFNLALMTLGGEGGLLRDKQRGIALMTRAAEKGLAKAQLYLGVYYTENDDHQQDFARAAFFFDAAASQDDADGQYFLGICYENGWGVIGSDEEAGKLYASAAQSGHPGATYNLAAFYEYGLGGIERDVVRAMSLYEKAAAQGNDSAILRLQEEQARMAVRQWEGSQHRDTPTSISDQVPDSPVSLRRTACSSPSLGDHMRHSFNTFWEEGLQSWTSWQARSLATSPGSARKVDFRLWDHQQDATIKEPYGFQTRERESCGTEMHRSSTMPNLSMVPVQ